MLLSAYPKTPRAIASVFTLQQRSVKRLSMHLVTVTNTDESRDFVSSRQR